MDRPSFGHNTDGDLVLAESAVIIECIVARYGNGRLVVAASHPDFAQFLYWFHFANGTLQPATGRSMILEQAEAARGQRHAAGH
jgi:glutathione S-transferase